MRTYGKRLIRGAADKATKQAAESRDAVFERFRQLDSENDIRRSVLLLVNDSDHKKAFVLKNEQMRFVFRKRQDIRKALLKNIGRQRRLIESLDPRREKNLLAVYEGNVGVGQGFDMLDIAFAPCQADEQHAKNLFFIFEADCHRQADDLPRLA